MTQTSTPTEPKKQPPVWKQLMGAVVGMFVALALYHVYQFAAPTVQAFLLRPDTMTRSALMGKTSFADKQITPQDETFKRIGAKTREIAQQMLANQKAANDPSQAADVMLAAITETSSADTMAFVSMEIAPSEQTSSVTIRPLMALNTTTANMLASAHTAAPGLPGSGPGLWMAGGLAFGLSWSMRKKIFAAA